MSNATLEHLRQLLNRRGTTPRLRTAGSSEPSPADWLPEHGLSAGEVSEWIAPCDGSGALQLALSALRLKLSPQARWLVVDSTGDFFPAAWEETGFSLSRTVFLRGLTPELALWAVEQSLRSRGVDVVCCRFSKLTSVLGRRLKIAAETGGSHCLMLRDSNALRETSWADLRMLVSPRPSPDWMRRRVRLEVLKLRNGVPGTVAEVELNDETGVVCLVSQLADSAPLHRATGA